MNLHRALSVMFDFLDPKNYSYRVVNAAGKRVDTVVKCKGFSLRYSATSHINFARMRRQVRNFVKGKDDPVAVYLQAIRRTKDHRIVSEVQRKIHRVVYKKRKLARESFRTLPFGY